MLMSKRPGWVICEQLDFVEGCEDPWVLGNWLVDIYRLNHAHACLASSALIRGRSVIRDDPESFFFKLSGNWFFYIRC